MQSTLWLATRAGASHFEPERQSFADRRRWPRVSARGSDVDWQVSRALLAHVRPTGRTSSLSHSGGFAALAVAPEGTRIGVDVELVDERRDVLRLARFAFGPSEVAQLEALPPDHRAERFYTLWTLKEACIKAFGLTLLHGLRRCVFTLEDGLWRADLPQRGWQARVYRPRAALYLATISAPAASEWFRREWPGASVADWPLALAMTSTP